MPSVQIDSDGAGGQRLQRSYTFATGTIVSVYCRVRFPTIASTWAVPWQIHSAGNTIGPNMNGGASQLEWSNDGSAVVVLTGIVATAWYDIAFRKNGSVTEVYAKLATADSWNERISAATASFTPTTFTLGDYPLSSSLANRSTRYGKIVIWDQNRDALTVKAEANGRELQDSGRVWFYNDCRSAANFGIDMASAAHNFTVTGTPVDNVDDPRFKGPNPTLVYGSL